jgi:hypothetical protein
VKRLLIGLGALALAGACAGGGDAEKPAAGGSAGSAATGAGGSGGPSECLPGSHEICACLGGTDGSQVCQPDGRGYGPCTGCDPTPSGGSGGTAGSAGSAGSGSGGPTCAQIATQQGWNTFFCEQDDSGTCQGSGETSADCAYCCSGPSCGDLAAKEGWTNASCEWNGNGACQAQGPKTYDCDHCCGSAPSSGGSGGGGTCQNECNSGERGCYAPTLGWKCTLSGGCWTKQQISCQTSQACYTNPDVCVDGCPGTPCTVGEVGCYAPNLGWKCESAGGCTVKTQITCQTSTVCYTNPSQCVNG